MRVKVYRPLTGSLVVTLIPTRQPVKRQWIPSLSEYRRMTEMGWPDYSQWKALRLLGVGRPVLLKDGTWSVARTYQADLPQQLADSYGECELVQDYNNRQKCDKRCRNAAGDSCECSCLGKYHGDGGTDFDNGPGIEVGEDTLVSVNGDITTTTTIIRKKV